jgi:hypothetical protein
VIIYAYAPPPPPSTYFPACTAPCSDSPSPHAFQQPLFSLNPLSTPLFPAFPLTAPTPPWDRPPPQLFTIKRTTYTATSDIHLTKVKEVLVQSEISLCIAGRKNRFLTDYLRYVPLSVNIENP